MRVEKERERGQPTAAQVAAIEARKAVAHELKELYRRGRRPRERTTHINRPGNPREAVPGEVLDEEFHARGL